jgi:Nucleotidyl transferase AbiEii toxin, Type IV TA system
VSTERRKPPGNLAHLQRLANTAAAAADMPVGRYQRWINVHIISAVLDRARDEYGEPLFVLKGGAAMELRLGLHARASKDYDAAFRDRADDILAALDEALSADWRGFQLQRTEPQTIRDTGAMRTEIKLAYKGRPWGTVQLEIAPAEGQAGREIERVPARPLDLVQIEGPQQVACVSVRYQIAQKIHACTEVYLDGRDNERFRDLIDILLLRELVADSDLADVREACVEIFELRGKHAWPPQVAVYPSWAAGFAAMAHEVGFFTGDVDVAADALRGFIGELDAAPQAPAG